MGTSFYKKVGSDCDYERQTAYSRRFVKRQQSRIVRRYWKRNLLIDDTKDVIDEEIEKLRDAEANRIADWIDAKLNQEADWIDQSFWDWNGDWLYQNKCWDNFFSGECPMMIPVATELTAVVSHEKASGKVKVVSSVTIKLGDIVVATATFGGKYTQADALREFQKAPHRFSGTDAALASRLVA